VDEVTWTTPDEVACPWTDETRGQSPSPTAGERLRTSSTESTTERVFATKLELSYIHEVTTTNLQRMELEAFTITVTPGS
jgi:hypothetical protein